MIEYNREKSRRYSYANKDRLNMTHSCAICGGSYTTNRKNNHGSTKKHQNAVVQHSLLIHRYDRIIIRMMAAIMMNIKVMMLMTVMVYVDGTMMHDGCDFDG